MKLKLETLLKRAEAFYKLAEPPELAQELPELVQEAPQEVMPPPTEVDQTLPITGTQPVTPNAVSTNIPTQTTTPAQEFDERFDKAIQDPVDDIFNFLSWVYKNNLSNLLTEEHYKIIDQKISVEPFWLDVYYAYCTKKLGNRHNIFPLIKKYVKSVDDSSVLSFLKRVRDDFTFEQLAELVQEKLMNKSGYSLREFLKILEESSDYNPEIMENILIECVKNDSISTYDLDQLIQYDYEDLDHIRLIEESLKGQPSKEDKSSWIHGFERLYLKYRMSGVKAEPILQRMFELEEINQLIEFAEKASELEIPEFPYAFIGELLMKTPDPCLWLHDYVKSFGQYLSEDTVKALQERAQSTAETSMLVEMFNRPSIVSKMNPDSFMKFLVETKASFLVSSIAKNLAESPNFDIVAIQKIVENSGNEQTIADFLAAATNSKFNFASYKKRYNDTINKGMKEDPKRLGRVLISTQRNVESRTNPEFRQEALNFGEELINKGDWFTLKPYVFEAITGNIYVEIYKRSKNKSFSSLYHEAFKANYNTVSKLRYISNQFAYSYHSEVASFIRSHTFQKLAETSNNFDQYLKLLLKTVDATKIMHDEGLSLHLAELAILNPKFDINDATNREFLAIMEDFEIIDDIGIESKLEQINRLAPNMLNIKEFLINRKIFMSLYYKFNKTDAFSLQRNTPEYLAVKQLHSDLAIITEFETVKEYVRDAKPKDPKMAEMSLDMVNGIQFKVLKYLDPKAFRVGIETNCCQRIGGAGEDAAIDSYINPLAGVLILYVQGVLVAQSYFHYVPEQNGLILDNVESNQRNMKHLGLNELYLTKIYADYAAELKKKMPDLAYIKCGTEYNKINNDMFGKEKMEEDPRSFEVDEPYSDFDEHEHLNLLAPKEDLAKIILPPTSTQKTAKHNAKRLTVRAIRKLALQALTLQS